MKSSIGVASIMNKMRENRLRWFGHAMRREMKINVEGKIGKGRPKKKWLDTIENKLV
jgi:hypothetical protein